MSQDCLDLLYHLYRKKALSEKHSRSIKAIDRDGGDRIDLDEALGVLEMRGFITCKKKRERNYWALSGKTIWALATHDYPLFRSGITRL